MAYFAFLRGFGDCAKIIHSLTHSFNYDGNECLGAGHVLGILDTAVDKRDKSPRLQGAYILVGDSGNKQISKTHVVSLGHKQEGKEWRGGASGGSVVMGCGSRSCHFNGKGVCICQVHLKYMSYIFTSDI